MFIRLVLLALFVCSTAAADDGTLRIKTDVSDVEVLLDGQSVGRTPVTLNPVAAGTHQLILTKPGFADHEEQVQVQSGTTAKIFVMMKALASELPKLPAEFYAIHQHAAGGSCTGILTVTADAIDYRSHDGHDVFHIPMQELRSVSRSMGPAWWTARPLTTAAQNSACRLEVPGRSYGFFAYDENASVAGIRAEKHFTQQETSKKTTEMFELIYRLWTESLDQKQQRKGAAR